jgi:antitoxin PrlF
MTMPTSTITSKGQTTVPKEVRDALDVGPGDKLTWDVRDGRVVITTDGPGLWRWQGFVKDGPDDPVRAVADARKRRGRI